jgi:hypothetical protein
MLDRIKNGRKPKLRTKTEDGEMPKNNEAEVPSEPTHQYTSEESTDLKNEINAQLYIRDDPPLHCIGGMASGISRKLQI